MKPKTTQTAVSVGALSLIGGGLLTGCEADDIQAVVAGVELVADTIEEIGGRGSDDVSFQDWLLSELSD